MAKSIKELKKQGAKTVLVACTHGLFIGGAIEKLLAADCDEIISTDTIETDFSKVSVAECIAATLLKTDSTHKKLRRFYGDKLFIRPSIYGCNQTRVKHMRKRAQFKMPTIRINFDFTINNCHKVPERKAISVKEELVDWSYSYSDILHGFIHELLFQYHIKRKH